MNYKQLLILSLSGVAEWLNETEMIIPEEMRKDFSHAASCEFLGDGKCILCRYHGSGKLYWKIEYQNGRRHGFSFGWYENGRLHWKIEYQNNQLHGLSCGWMEDGQPYWKREWKNGKLIG